jgi:hypothetical protein
MTHPIAHRLLDRHLVDAIERLAVEFPDLAIDTITRAVRAVAGGHRDLDVRLLSDVVAAVEGAARLDLSRLAEAAAA